MVKPLFMYDWYHGTSCASHFLMLSCSCTLATRSVWMSSSVIPAAIGEAHSAWLNIVADRLCLDRTSHHIHQHTENRELTAHLHQYTLHDHPAAPAAAVYTSVLCWVPSGLQVRAVSIAERRTRKHVALSGGTTRVRQSR